MLFPPIYGQRVVLRNIAPQAVSTSYINWLSDPKINNYLEARHEIITVNTQRLFIDRINKSKDTCIFGIFVKGNRMIGTTKLGPIAPDSRSGDLGILIGDSEYWNKGLATEVIQILCEAFHKAGILKRVTAGASEKNIGSIKAFEKNRFVVEGFQHDAGIEESGLSVRNVILSKVF